MPPALIVALVGCGRWGRHILRDLRELGADVIVADPSATARATALADAAADACATVGTLPRVDAAVIASPTTTHAAAVEALLPRAVPLFCEKPLTADAASAARLAAAAGEHLFVMDKWRYHPGIEALRDIATSGALGRVEGLRTLRIGWDAPHPDVDAVWILAPHDLSIALEVLGHVPVALAAVAERAAGRVAGLTALLGRQPWMVLDVSVVRPGRQREARLYCRDGIATLADADSDHVLVEHLDRDGHRVAVERRPLANEPPLRRELRAFLGHLGGGPPPRSSAAEGAAIVRTLARLRELAGVAPREIADAT